jgi:hypothetical protein
VARELGALPKREEVEEILEEEFSRLLGPLEDETIPPEVWEEADGLARHFTSHEFIFTETGRRHPAIKIKEGTYLRYGLYKADGIVLRAEVEIEEGKIAHLKISGNLASLPMSKFLSFSQALRGVDFDYDRVTQKVTEFLRDHAIRCPGLNPENFAGAIFGEKGSLP